MASRPRYPAYQIDFQMISTGKMVAGSKRRIRWRFGFPSREALDAGLKGNDCRGEEHDITIVWSITSGKRMVMADGHQVHVSTKRSDIMEYSWTLRGNHVCKVVAYAAPPLSATAGFRQYDLFVDGMSYFTMPKVYQLGIRGNVSAAPRGGNGGSYSTGAGGGGAGPSTSSNGQYYDLRTGQYVGAPRNPQEEEAALQAAIQASLAESKQYVDSRASGSGDGGFANIGGSFASSDGGGGGGAPPPPAPPAEADLLDMFSEAIVPAPAPANPYANALGAGGAAPPQAAPAANTFDPNAAGFDIFASPSNELVPAAPQPGGGYSNYAVAANQGGPPAAAPAPPQQQQQQEFGQFFGGAPAPAPAPPAQSLPNAQAQMGGSFLGFPSAGAPPAPQQQPPSGDMFGGGFGAAAPAPQQQQQPPAGHNDPFGGTGGFGAGAPAPAPQQQQQPGNDPFGAGQFGYAQAQPPARQQQQQQYPPQGQQYPPQNASFGGGAQQQQYGQPQQPQYGQPPQQQPQQQNQPFQF